MAEQPKPTDAELDILQVLWEGGPGTVREIHERLDEDPPRGYTTVLKLLQIMSDKGLVRRNESNRAHVYRAAMAPGKVRGNLVKHLLARAFDNSTAQLVMQALTPRPATKDELAEIRRMLDDMERKSR